VVATALKAANLIGDGLYGVDLKQTERGVVVIEVNDNPNIETGVEDQILQSVLYRQVMETFARRLEREHR
jgi:glutathione synthase/RimK-type ligase-like ATP-grasp enzyme